MLFAKILLDEPLPHNTLLAHSITFNRQDLNVFSINCWLLQSKNICLHCGLPQSNTPRSETRPRSISVLSLFFPNAPFVGGEMHGRVFCKCSSSHLFFSLSLLQNAEVSVFEVNIRFVGGLLSAYYLSGKEVRNMLKLPVVLYSCHFTLKMDLAASCLIDKTDGTEQMIQGGDYVNECMYMLKICCNMLFYYLKNVSH